MKLTEWQKVGIKFTLSAAGVCGFCLAGLYILFHEKDYIVTAKGDNKITYRDISNPNNLHEMTFDGDTVFPEGGWYPYINVGDTIRGNARFMNNKSVMSVGRILNDGLDVRIIQSVNGRDLQLTQIKALHDSIMLETKQKTK